jgi:hypothetical protein
VPRYRFAVRNTDRFDDGDGVFLLDDGAARKYAIQIMDELQKNDQARLDGFYHRGDAGRSSGMADSIRPSFAPNLSRWARIAGFAGMLAVISVVLLTPEGRDAVQKIATSFSAPPGELAAIRVLVLFTNFGRHR